MPARRLREALLTALLLTIPFLVLGANLKEPHRINPVDRFLLRVSVPVQSLASRAASFVSEGLEEHVYHVEVVRENRQLQARLAYLESEAQRHNAAVAENERLRALLGLRERIVAPSVGATVIAKDLFSGFFRVARIRLDRGSADRVSPDMAVVSPEGLVGRVRRVFDRYCDVLLTVDRLSGVDVVVERTGARAVVWGTDEASRYVMEAQMLDDSDALLPGDLVHTSGLGLQFPAGILVGRVARVLERRPGDRQRVEVTPSVNFGALEEVLILTDGARAGGP